MLQDTSVQAYESGAFHTLGDRAYWHLVSSKIGAGLFVLLLAVAASVAASHLPPETAKLVRAASWLALLASGLAIGYAFVASNLIHKNTGFVLSPDAFKIRRGVFHKEEFAIPYRQIQNIEIERTFRQQMLGLSTLIILTAGNEAGQTGSDAPEGIIESVDREVAERVRDELLRRASGQKAGEASAKSHA